MTTNVQIRELSADEIDAVSGGNKADIRSAIIGAIVGKVIEGIFDVGIAEKLRKDIESKQASKK